MKEFCNFYYETLRAIVQLNQNLALGPVTCWTPFELVGDSFKHSKASMKNTFLLTLCNFYVGNLEAVFKFNDTWSQDLSRELFLTMGISKTPPRVFNIWWHKIFSNATPYWVFKRFKIWEQCSRFPKNGPKFQFRSFFRGRIICPYSVFGNFWGGDTIILKDIASATIITDKIKGTKPHVPTTPFS